MIPQPNLSVIKRINKKSNPSFISTTNFSVNSRGGKINKSTISNRSKILQSRNETFESFKDSIEDNGNIQT